MQQNNISSFVRPLSWQKSSLVIIYHDDKLFSVTSRQKRNSAW